MNLVERDDELRLLDRLYTGCATGGKGAVVLTRGPAGSGKTALLHAFADRVARRGGRFFAVTASGSERTHPFGLVDHLLCTIGGRDAGVRAHCGPALFGGPGAATDLPQRVHAVLSEGCGDRPLVIGVDDVHFADEPSLQCLRYIARRIESSRIMIVFNECSSHERRLAPLHAETLNLPYAHRIRLGGLSDDGVAAHVERRLGPEPARRIAAACAAVGGGNPLLTQALVDDHHAVGVPAALVPGESYRNAVLRCLYRSDPSALAVARAVAVLGDPVLPGLVAAQLGADATTVRRGLADLTAAGLLTAAGFRHEEARQAVLGDVPPDDLRAMHGRAAGLLHETGAGAVRVARRLLAAGDADGGEPWQIEVLREAANEALALGDAAEAVGYLRHASALCADGVLHARVTAALADAAWRLDPATASRHLPGLADAVRAGTLAGREAMIPVHQLLWRGDHTQARELLALVQARDDDHRGLPPNLPVSSEASLTRLWLHFCFPGLPEPPGGESPGPASDPPPGPDAALTLLSRLTGQDGADGTFHATEQVLRGTRADAPFALTLIALMPLFHTDRADATAWAGRLLDEPWIRKVPLRRALLATLRASAALRRGDAAAAAELARTALTVISPASWGVVVGVPLAVAVRAATDLGDAGAVGPYLNLQVPEAMFDTLFALPYLVAFGRHQLATGRPQAALENFRACGNLLVDWGLDESGVIDWRNEAAEALLALGRAEEARVLAAEQLALSAGERSRSRGVALRLLAATGRLSGRVTLLEEAVDALRAGGDRRELGRAEADLRAARAALDEQARARMRLLWTPPPSGAEPPGPARPGTGLTDAEHRVAALAADGWTNRQIAVKLYITVSTVEQHLTKIYRKLRVRGRPDLASVLTESCPPPPPRERVT